MSENYSGSSVRHGRKKAIVLSVPFQRLVKHFFAIPFISSLPKDNDLIIVAPFELDQENKEYFGLEKAIWIIDDQKIGRLQGLFLLVTDLIRRYGYWENFKNTSLRYYSRTKYLVFKTDGRTVPLRFPARLVGELLTFIGMKRSRWLYLEKLVIDFLPVNLNLEKVASVYRDVILIQAANWGVQDRKLARFSERYKWRKFLLPYTTDQLYTNGYLFTDYNGIFVQGPFERECAETLHHYTSTRLVNLGNSWFRNIDFLRASEAMLHEPERLKIFYAGVSQEFYPFESELKAVELISRVLSERNIEFEVIYRPVLQDERQKLQISKRLSQLPGVFIDWPATSVIALGDSSHADYKSDLKNYIKALQGVDLFIMSYLTSMSLDASYISGCRVVSNMIDEFGILASRHTDLFPTSLLGDDLTVVRRFDELSKFIVQLVDLNSDFHSNAMSMTNLWDYPESDYSKLIRTTLGEGAL